MKIILVVLSAVAAVAAGSALAQSGPEVLKAKGCLNCHEMDKKKVGPAYKDVAVKFKDDKNAEATLLDKIKEGKNHPKIAASDAELKAAIQTVLSTK